MSAQTTQVNFPWTPLSQEKNLFLIHDVRYKEWKFQPSPRHDLYLAPLAEKIVSQLKGTSSSLSRDIEAVFAKLNNREANPLTALAEEAITSMKGQPDDQGWSKRIAKQITDAAD